jgi:predicted RNA-binding protein with PUA-like domain
MNEVASDERGGVGRGGRPRARLPLVATFLLKTEPTEYSFDDLIRDKRAVWEGVSNNAALAHIRSARKGDEALVYHTGDEKAVVGLAKIVSAPYEDPSQAGRNDKGEPKMAVFDIAPLKRAKSPVTLAALKADKRFAAFALVRQPRLSVMPVPPDLDVMIRKMAGL